MRADKVQMGDTALEVYSLNTVVVGSGAAGLNAADRLYTYGQRDIAVVTEGLKMGTSRNTGSDKQTYYKLTLAGAEPDSIMSMAQTLFDGGGMEGDIALVEAALSPQCFYHLVDIGVPFPHNSFGEYVGYKTDHDPRQRATSAGPLTSRYMTEKLEKQVTLKGIPIFDGYQVIGILTDDTGESAIGLLALNLGALQDSDGRYAAFNCTNIIYAVGGPAGMYQSSVYPESQTGSSGIAFEAGVRGRNLTESQYGIASTAFRWNLSGTYQQVLPRYVSMNPDGSDEREFLREYFDAPGKMLDAIFLKGYQWPFDPRKIENAGSSLIDVLVYHETVVKGRKVYLDYTRNSEWGSKSGSLDFSLLGGDAFHYLKKSGSLFGNPLDRLQHMNEPAVTLYKEHGIDLSKEYLEIAVCAQHNNGGLSGNAWWESNIKHLFPVGEISGTHGVYRPGGSALNSGQVGSTRAAQFISARYGNAPMALEDFTRKAQAFIKDRILWDRELMSRGGGSRTAADILYDLRKRMTKAGAHIRSLGEVEHAAREAEEDLIYMKQSMQISSAEELSAAYKTWDLLITQYVYLSAIADYIRIGGKSRGSYLIHDPHGELPAPGLPESLRFVLEEDNLKGKVQEVQYREGICRCEWREVKPIPCEDQWFENVWNAYRKNLIIV